MNDESPENYRQWVATNYNSDIKEQLYDIYKESLYYAKDDPSDQNGAGRISKTIAKASTLMARLSHDQERIHSSIRFFTIWLFVITVVLAFLTSILAYDVVQRFCHKDAPTNYGQRSNQDNPSPTRP